MHLQKKTLYDSFKTSETPLLSIELRKDIAIRKLIVFKAVFKMMFAVIEKIDCKDIKIVL